MRQALSLLGALIAACTKDNKNAKLIVVVDANTAVIEKVLKD